jgi:hypothetical protein
MGADVGGTDEGRLQTPWIWQSEGGGMGGWWLHCCIEANVEARPRGMDSLCIWQPEPAMAMVRSNSQQRANTEEHVKQH